MSALDWDDLLALRPLPRLRVLVDCAEDIDAETSAHFVPRTWVTLRGPGCLLSRSGWQRLYDLAGYTVDGAPASRPIRPLAVYRGTAPQRGPLLVLDDICGRCSTVRDVGGSAFGRQKGLDRRSTSGSTVGPLERARRERGRRRHRPTGRTRPIAAYLTAGEVAGPPPLPSSATRLLVKGP